MNDEFDALRESLRKLKDEFERAKGAVGTSWSVMSTPRGIDASMIIADESLTIQPIHLLPQDGVIQRAARKGEAVLSPELSLLKPYYRKNGKE